MNTQSKTLAVYAILFNLLLSGCGAGQVFGPTVTPTPTITFTPTLTPTATATFTPSATSTPTATFTPTATPTREIPQFKICSPEDFRDCPIDVEDIFDGDYLNWLYTLSKQFDPKSIKNVALENFSNMIRYNTATVPNFTKKGTEPFRRDVTAGHITYLGHDYIVMPIEYFDINHPDKNQWVITVHPLYNDTHDFSDTEVKARLNTWRNKMNITVILTNNIPGFCSRPDPLVSMTFTNNSDMKDRFNRFIGERSLKVEKQDMTALSDPGIILLSMIATNPPGYKQLFK